MNAIKVMNVTTKTSFMNIKYIKSTLKIECLFTLTFILPNTEEPNLKITSLSNIKFHDIHR